jgi:hypothetical protein
MIKMVTLEFRKAMQAKQAVGRPISLRSSHGARLTHACFRNGQFQPHQRRAKALHFLIMPKQIYWNHIIEIEIDFGN